jgi:hypothetical protein
MTNDKSTADAITAETFLPEIVRRYPATRAVLDRYGLHGCGIRGPREQLGGSRGAGVQLSNC